MNNSKCILSIFVDQVSEDQCVHVLNPLLFGDYFEHYKVSATTATWCAGIIAQHTGQTLRINVTRTLTDVAWVQFVGKCRQHTVHLCLYCSKGVRIPTVFEQYIAINQYYEPYQQGIADALETDNELISDILALA